MALNNMLTQSSEGLETRKEEICQIGWCTTLIQALRKKETGGVFEFNGSLVYKMRPCLKKRIKKKEDWGTLGLLSW